MLWRMESMCTLGGVWLASQSITVLYIFWLPHITLSRCVSLSGPLRLALSLSHCTMKGVGRCIVSMRMILDEVRYAGVGGGGE